MTRSVMITGVNGGIGLVLSRMFKEQGYHTIGLDKQENKSDCDRFIQVDLSRYVSDSNYQDYSNELIYKEIDQLKVLINNAAVQVIGHFSQIKPTDWLESIAVNLSAPFLLSQVCYKSLQKNNGSIINISSIHATLTKKNFTAYASSKAGLSGFTKALAVDAQGQIRVNAICPAAIETEMLKAGFEGKEESYKLLQQYHPSKIIGSAEEVSRLALFMADERNKFLNGSIIDLDGGIGSVLHDPDTI